MNTIDKIQFLKDLAQNNNREWFAEHKKEYDAIAKDNKAFFQEIFQQLQRHDDVTDMHIFRIYKDVRFSKDKSPYKTNFGASFTRRKPELRGGYYVHIEPNNSFVGGGFWAPEKEDVFRVRKEFEMDDEPIRKIIAEPTFQKYFEEIKAYDSLKTAPRGFYKNHPAIDLIKMKHWVVMRPFSDKELADEDFSKEIIATFLAMRPWFDYMSEVLTTNLNGESII
ncbi:DUF2461 domain-containing protein [Capnocytophaga catalasegens]|uniref:TIGR02453 family protein n=1 Tax=Capnocytophaga catalasegens TaxID=1004260 RepID=A0AAV5AX51_9FLAO|nr:DUF2461 domain-containing protein [Capnocytophaga catalasegens]GIZ15088.1 TIGR02453 family protein [Capnocytophaga catalasegens]GJM50027.1 TIGR02453 family protein [Capnocytophaga catalasegens]GJM53898.1 TIGR02453 family protein [Capnocytophaga catalasegens]